MVVGIDPPKHEASLPLPKSDGEKAREIARAMLLSHWEKKEIADVVAAALAEARADGKAEAYAEAARVLRRMADEWGDLHAGLSGSASKAEVLDQAADAIEARAKEVAE